MRIGKRTAALAWLVTSIFYLFQYALRSAPAVMMPQLADAFGLTAAGAATMAGLFYYGYSPFSLVAGVAMDRLGPRRVVPIGCIVVGAGALLFASGNTQLAAIGRVMQGAGGVFALIGAVYIATTSFSASSAATLIGATQMFGMAGGSAGQFVVGPLVSAGVAWTTFWTAMGIGGLAIGVLLFVLIPASMAATRVGPWLKPAVQALRTVFANPQSILCGTIAGLLFIPTTIFDMIWGVRYLQDAHGIDYSVAVLRSSTVPLGWIVGCPLLGFISDRIGRRKPVIIAGGVALMAALAWMLFGDASAFPPYVLGFAAGVASGAAMLPYTVIKEVNPPDLSGTASGVVNFLNFTFSAVLAPAFGWLLASVSAGAVPMRIEHYQTAFTPLLVGVALAVVLTFFLKETGEAVRYGSTTWNREVRTTARKVPQS